MELNGDLMELVNNCFATQKQDVSKIPTAMETADLLVELGFTKAVKNIKGKINPILKKAQIAAGGYIEITPAKIQEFLNKKAEAYNKTRPKLKKKEEPSSVSGIGLAAMYGNLYNQVMSAGGGLANQAYQNAQINGPMNQLSGVSGPNVQWVQSAASQHYYGVDPGSLILTTDATPQRSTLETFEAQTQDFISREPNTIGRFQWLEVPIDSYEGVPPLNVLKKFKDEIQKKIFDFFTIASVNAVRDPLLLGRIEGSDSRFYVAQWGDDVSLDDLI